MAVNISSTMRRNESFELEGMGDPNHAIEDSDFEDDSAQGLLGNKQSAYSYAQSPLRAQILKYIPFLGARQSRRSRQSLRRRSCLSFLFSCQFLVLYISSICLVLGIIGTLFPSYTDPPQRYDELRTSIGTAETTLGAGNPRKEKVYIAASIFDKDGSLARGKWAQCVLDLIRILGPENAYLSIYENDAGEVGKVALNELKQKVPCGHTLRFDDHLGFEEVKHVILPDGSKRARRIEYLSEARNRALIPLESSSIRYDKILYLNDVVFDPIEAVQLLFLTNADATEPVTSSRANYRAACAVDFVNPLKFYDTFATRDHEGYGIGLPLYPWFTSAGRGVSRKQVQSGSDAVQVRSCWGGMVAFDATFFQSPLATNSKEPDTAGHKSPANFSVPYRFRAEDEMFWDASECCLIHADIQSSGFDPLKPEKFVSGIYMNPYVRTAYDEGTLQWLNVVRRFERLLSPVHWILTKIVGMPWYNPRRQDEAGIKVQQQIWVPDVSPGAVPGVGSFQITDRAATHSGFCGSRSMELMKSPEDMAKGGKPWEFAPIPAGGR